MRVSRIKAADNRRQILSAAARLFRERGIETTGVDAITGAVGLTHGGLYSQFGSKDRIAAEAIRSAFAHSRENWQRIVERNPRSALMQIVRNYLSPAHRDTPGRGCVVAALAGDLARQPPAIRDVFTGELKQGLEFLAALLSGTSESDRYDSAIVAFAMMSGAIAIARAVNDGALSDRIIRVTGERIVGGRKKRRAAILRRRAARPG